jgi:hypothetical protein
LKKYTKAWIENRREQYRRERRGAREDKRGRVGGNEFVGNVTS